VTVVFIFSNKTNFHIGMAIGCFGPFPDEDAAHRWLNNRNEQHYVIVKMEEPK
jgi:hypothetical protein